MAGRSVNNIGYLYFEQNNMIEAIRWLQKALGYFDKSSNDQYAKLQSITNIGRAYEGVNQLDSACCYFDKGLNFK